MEKSVSSSNNESYAGNASCQLHHRTSLGARLTTLRECIILGRALRAAQPIATVLDLPCGTGRLWPAFAKAGVSSLIAADFSQGMLDISMSNRLSGIFPKTHLLTSVFEIGLPADAVEFIACMHFYPDLSTPADRQRVLSELRRVSRDYVAISLRVDGNIAAIRHLRRPPVISDAGYDGQVIRRSKDVEQEFRQAGYKIVEYFDVWPGISMWRLYLLRCTDV